VSQCTLRGGGGTWEISVLTGPSGYSGAFGAIADDFARRLGWPFTAGRLSRALRRPVSMMALTGVTHGCIGRRYFAYATFVHHSDGTPGTGVGSLIPGRATPGARKRCVSCRCRASLRAQGPGEVDTEEIVFGARIPRACSLGSGEGEARTARRTMVPMRMMRMLPSLRTDAKAKRS
jgi:hypothetical protein